MTLASGGSPMFPLVVHQSASPPSGQQCSHSGGVCPQIQGRQCGAYVGAVALLMSNATAMVRVDGMGWLKPVATVLLMLCCDVWCSVLSKEESPSRVSLR